MWKLGTVKNSEWVELKGQLHCACPIECENSNQLISIEILKKNCKNSFFETAQCDIIRVKEGLFIVNPDSRYHYPPVFQPIEPQAFCLLP